VEGTLKACACAVGRKLFLNDERSKPMASLTSGAASHAASLARRCQLTTISARHNAERCRTGRRVNTVRFNEMINGRQYVIEVLAVGPNRWRAQIAQVPGGRTALMPFYGVTPEEAARHLSGWLTRASREST
jgi:hypothetical protein